MGIRQHVCCSAVRRYSASKQALRLRCCALRIARRKNRSLVLPNQTHHAQPSVRGDAPGSRVTVRRCLASKQAWQVTSLRVTHGIVQWKETSSSHKHLSPKLSVRGDVFIPRFASLAVFRGGRPYSTNAANSADADTAPDSAAVGFTNHPPAHSPNRRFPTGTSLPPLPDSACGRGALRFERMPAHAERRTIKGNSPRAQHGRA